jgi:hypothetical protein
MLYFFEKLGGLGFCSITKHLVSLPAVVHEISRKIFAIWAIASDIFLLIPFFDYFLDRKNHA